MLLGVILLDSHGLCDEDLTPLDTTIATMLAQQTGMDIVHFYQRLHVALAK
eukprot:COSAG01_NODE_4792_length_4740_cov_8.902392_5_plen_51_part_00